MESVTTIGSSKSSQKVLHDRWADLLSELGRGNEAALGEFYDLSSARVFGVVKRIVRNTALAEEITSDVYLQVWQQASHFDPTRGSPLAWLLTIARSRALDALRRRDRAVSHPAPEELVEGELLEDRDGASLVETFQEGTQVRHAIARLTSAQQQLVNLAFFRDMTHQEIAAVTGKPLGTVKSTLRAALQQLQRSLSELAPTEGQQR